MYFNARNPYIFMRLFIGIDISLDLKSKIMEIQEKFKRFHIKFVEPQNLHFCMMFLGDVKEDKLDLIKTAMKNISEKTDKFEIGIAGIGAFPNKENASVFFLDVKEGRKNLNGLALLLRKELPEFKSGKSFTAHLTLGRVKSDQDKLKPIFDKIENIDIGKMTVDKIVLINSNLTPKGPIYEEIFTTTMGN